jgi:hypothetical protein
MQPGALFGVGTTASAAVSVVAASAGDVVLISGAADAPDTRPAYPVGAKVLS